MDSLSQATPEAQKDQAQNILRRLQLPPEISDIDVRLGTDTSGEPALWLVFHVRPGIETGKSEVEKLTRFTYEVQSKIFDDGILLFPYTVLEQAA